MPPRVIRAENSVLLVVDIQERFLPIVRESERLVANARVLLRAAGMLGIPVLVTEQYPQGLGRTVEALMADMPEGAVFLEKTAFGGLGEDTVRDALGRWKRNQVLVCGLETHVCVNQTVHQLLAEGYEPHVVEDALSSRSEANHGVGVRKMTQSGAVPSCVEMVLFELMRSSRHPQFKALQGLIK